MRWVLLRVMPLLLLGCTNNPPNHPYPSEDDHKNILYSTFEERPKHLDPAQSYSSNEIVFTGQIYEPPFQYHYLKRPYTLVPLTAVAIPEPVYLDAHGTPVEEGPHVAFSQYDIEIQQGIFYAPHPAFAKEVAGRFLYHDLDEKTLRAIWTLDDFPQMGTRELIAEDYVYEIKRLAHPAIHSPIYGFMAEYIVGLKEYASLLAEAAKKQTGFLDLRDFPLRGAQALGPHTYRITLHGKYPQFLYWLAMPFFAPIPYEADRFYTQPGLIEKNITLDVYPVGTGPYQLAVSNPNREMVMTKNPRFHGETYPTDGEESDRTEGLLLDAGRPLPFIDRVVFKLERESIPIWNKFLQGYYDASGVSSDSFDQVIRMDTGEDPDLTDRMKRIGIRLRTSTAATTFYTGFNMLDPVVGGYTEDRRKLRQAISIAIDEEESISIFQNGRGMAMQGPIPPGIFGYVEGKAGINPITYDLDAGQHKRKPITTAKRLLREAGYPDGRHAKTGVPLVLNFDTAATGPEAKASLDWLRKQFSKLDIQLNIRSTDYNRFQDKILKGDAQIFQWGWNADYPDPENFLFLLYGPNAKAGSNGENATNYANPEFDRLFVQMKNIDNGPERQALIHQMVEIFRGDAPWASGFHPKQFALYHAWYTNIKPNLMANNTLKYIKIDPILRAEQRHAWNRPAWEVAGVMIFGTTFLVGYMIHKSRPMRSRRISQ